LFIELQQNLNDVDYKRYRNKKFVLKQISKLIKSNPKLVAGALERSNISIVNPNDKRELVDKTAYALANSLNFPSNIGKVLALKEAEAEYSNLGGKGKVDWKGELANTGKKIGGGAAGGAKSGGLVGVIVGAVVGAVDAGFSWARAKKDAKIEEEQFRQELIGDLLGGKKKKTNYLPIYILGGVLIVGGVVTYYALKD